MYPWKQENMSGIDIEFCIVDMDNDKITSSEVILESW